MTDIKVDSLFIRDLSARLSIIGETAYLAKGSDTYELGGIELSIWKLLDGSRTLGAISDQISSEYSHDPTAVLDDLVDFVRSLVDHGLSKKKVQI